MKKSTKTILITILILAIIALFIFAIFFFKKNISDLGTVNEKQNEKLSFFGFISDNSFGLLPNTKTKDPDSAQEINPADSNENVKLPVLRMISKGPIAGATSIKKTAVIDLIDNTEEERVFARFINRETGHVNDTDILTMEEKRMSNTTIPKIYEAFWGEDGEYTIVRYFDEESGTIKSFSGNIIHDDVIQEGSTEGFFLPDDITNLSVSQDGKRLFYLTDEQTHTIGSTSAIDGSKVLQIFNFQFTEWIPQWIGDYIFITTKASSDVKGYLYSLGKNTGTMNRILGDIKGLTTLVDNAGEKILYSESTRKGFSLFLFDIEKGSKERVPFETLPEKCIWSKDSIKLYCAVPLFIPNADYPDDVYKGLISFEDNVWVFDTETKELDVLIEVSTIVNTTLDMTKLFLDEDEQYLFFTNKKDRSLWLLELEK